MPHKEPWSLKHRIIAAAPFWGTILLWLLIYFLFVAPARAGACEPNSLNWYNAQPAVSWYADDIYSDGYQLWWRPVDGTWQPCELLPIWTDPLTPRKIHWGTDILYPIQRCIDEQLIEVEIGVKAYNNVGFSLLSNTVVVCMPHIWQCCEPYE